MSTVTQIEAAVTELSESELREFSAWFEEFIADQWDRQIEEDARAGRLDALAAEADRDFEAGRCKPL